MQNSDTPRLIAQSSDLLHAMFDREQGLFAYSTRMDGDGYVNDFDHPAVHRYTINTLAGIQRALRYHDLDWDLGAMLDLFLERQLARVNNPGDRGLLLYVLATSGHEARHIIFEELESLARDRSRLLRLTLQEICWVLIGLTRHAAIERSDRAVSAAERCFTVLHRSFLNRDTLIPFYAASGFRRRYSSFGGIAYFLKAMHDYAMMASDRYAEAIFKEGTRQIIRLQGAMGEWPWFINANTARVIDWYQVYSVHQDAMAMLFLLPALDLGVEEAREAIVRSYRWTFGENELRTSLIHESPFFISRSIRRKGRWERERRFARALVSSAFGVAGKPAATSTVEVNPECRSYHIGWIMYAWAGREDFTEFTALRLPTASDARIGSASDRPALVSEA